eukprot:m.273329 g.273329  ORF g.273329 m.273329 type:complete len:154 (-) comp106253_c0_seq1:549-1010(-)
MMHLIRTARTTLLLLFVSCEILSVQCDDVYEKFPPTTWELECDPSVPYRCRIDGPNKDTSCNERNSVHVKHTPEVNYRNHVLHYGSANITSWKGDSLRVLLVNGAKMGTGGLQVAFERAYTWMLRTHDPQFVSQNLIPFPNNRATIHLGGVSL